ncbi:15667_t:CDS:2, partial [Funneliformis geosporum]
GYNTAFVKDTSIIVSELLHESFSKLNGLIHKLEILIFIILLEKDINTFLSDPENIVQLRLPGTIVKELENYDYMETESNCIFEGYFN